MSVAETTALGTQPLHDVGGADADGRAEAEIGHLLDQPFCRRRELLADRARVVIVGFDLRQRRFRRGERIDAFTWRGVQRDADASETATAVEIGKPAALRIDFAAGQRHFGSKAA